MYRINPNNTITVAGHNIPFDLFAEACKVLVAREDEGTGCYKTPTFMVFRGIGVVRREHLLKVSRAVSFKHIRKS